MSIHRNGFHHAFLDALTDSTSSAAATRRDEADVTYIRYIEGRIGKVAPEIFRVAFGRAAGGASSHAHVHSGKIFELMRDVAGCIRRVHQFGINDAVDESIQKGYLPQRPSDVQLNMFTRVVFVLCGWMTMMYSPDLGSPASPADAHNNPEPTPALWGSTALMADCEGVRSHLATAQPIECARRPLVELLRGFGDVLPVPMGAHSTPADIGASYYLVYPSGTTTITTTTTKANTLLVSFLNADTVCSIGGLEIVWVHSLSSHFILDCLDRKLLLFCLPSFCKINMVEQIPFAKVYNEYYDCPGLDGGIPSSFLREILLSYRLVFGDDKRSRNLYRTSERKKTMERLGLDEEPTLDSLCGFEAEEHS